MNKARNSETKKLFMLQEKLVALMDAKEKASEEEKMILDTHISVVAKQIIIMQEVLKENLYDQV